MSDREYDTLKKQQLERICSELFHIDLHINKLVIPDVPTYKDSFTSIFKSGHTLYALCEAETPLTLAQVRSTIKQMGMEADAYFPPGNDGSYFTRFARQAFLAVFPGREVVNDDDLIYYQTLTPYSPALVRIKRVNGHINRYNGRTKSWQRTMEFSYFHPQVQLR